MKLYHLNIIATQEDVDEVNRVGWDGHPRFTMHADITGFGGQKSDAAAAAFSEGFYKLVADFPELGADVEAHLETVFSLTQNLEADGWVAEIRDHAKVDRARSTSVGDVIEHDGRFYLVDSFGFTELEALRQGAAA